MFTLLTGLPGSSKSLQTIKLVEKERMREDGTKRSVYYWGIPELKLDWIPLTAPGVDPAEARARYDQGVMASDPKDAHHWFELPPGSIVVMDECHEIFPKRKQGSPEPPHVAALAVHRHKGFDLYGMSQHPQKMDIDARRQVQRHWHLERPFGLDYANALQWERCMSPDDRAARAQANVVRMSLDKSIFGLYKSADVHTVKKRLPWKKIAVAVGSLVLVVGLFLFAFSRLGEHEVSEAEVAPGSPAQLEREPSRGLDWSEGSLRPRIPHWPWSAPFYDAAVKIVSVPRVRGCMSMQIGNIRTCKCHNGQGDAGVSLEVCRDFMAGRVFDPTAEVAEAKASNVAYLEKRDAGGMREGGQTDGDRVPSPPRSGS